MYVFDVAGLQIARRRNSTKEKKGDQEQIFARQAFWKNNVDS